MLQMLRAMSNLCDDAGLGALHGLQDGQDLAEVLDGVRVDLLGKSLALHTDKGRFRPKEKKIISTHLLGGLGEDNELVLVLLEALDVGLDGLEAGVAAAVVDRDANGQGGLERRLGERLLH